MVYYVHNGIVYIGHGQSWGIAKYLRLRGRANRGNRNETEQYEEMYEKWQTEANGSLPHLVMYHKARKTSCIFWVEPKTFS